MARAEPLSRSWKRFPNLSPARLARSWVRAGGDRTRRPLGCRRVGLPSGPPEHTQPSACQWLEVKKSKLRNSRLFRGLSRMLPPCKTQPTEGCPCFGSASPGLRLVVGAGLTPSSPTCPAGVTFYSSSERVLCASVYLSAPGTETFATFPAFFRYWASAEAFP